MKKKLLSLLLAVTMVVTSLSVSPTGKDMTVTAKAAENIELNGLLAQYYTTNGNGTNVTFGDKKSAEVVKNISFSDLDPTLIAMTGQADYAGARYSGYITVPESGNYTFYSMSDNGMRIRVNGNQLIDYWNGDSWSVPQTSQTVALEAGQKYTFEADYFDFMGGSNATVYWSNDKSIKAQTIIPASAFTLKDYSGCYVSEINTEGATLKEGSMAGNMVLEGQGLTADTTVEIVKAGGEAIGSGCFAEITGVNDGGKSLTIKVPANLKYGTYAVKVVSNGVTMVSKAYFYVAAASDKSSRSEYPRPDWEHLSDGQKDTFLNLNGSWDFDFDETEVGLNSGWYEEDHTFSQKINVPFCWESELSGIQNTSYQGQAWYQRVVTKEELNKFSADKNIVLYFGAVDWKSRVYVNGELVGTHEGGYTAFEFDVTEYLNLNANNVITVWVEDKASYGDDSYPALVGKQGRNAPCGYTHNSGIWQTVMLEERASNVNLDYTQTTSKIDDATVAFTLGFSTTDSGKTSETYTVEGDFESYKYDMTEDKDVATGSSLRFSQSAEVTFTETGDTGRVSLGGNTYEALDGTIVEPTVDATNYDSAVVEKAYAGGKKLYTASVTLSPEKLVNQKLWNYNDAQLYYGTFTIKDSNGKIVDKVKTYFGQREVGTKVYDGNGDVAYITINHNAVYLSGLLDQGFWEEGIYTAPTEEALKYDIQVMREDGFNMIRKHIKVEDPIQYYWCDKMGMTVWQDMPHATDMQSTNEGQITTGRACFEDALKYETQTLAGRHPSFIAIMLFNETWGLNEAYNNEAGRLKTAYDGFSTKTWIERLYGKAKEWCKNDLLIEDMSACNYDHVQPTDLKTYHMYPGSYEDTVGVVKRWAEEHVTKGDKDGWKFGNSYDGEPILNSEYGGVGAGAGDYDISYCFKYMTDIQRRYPKQSGFVYTEPYDVEYERNGFMTYERKIKELGYTDIAYGGDMSIVDLTGDVYLGFDANPAAKANPGSTFSTVINAMNWTPETISNAKVKWRFDGTDIYGNDISCEASGEENITLSPYKQVVKEISFTVPDRDCVGTLTAWIEDAQGTKVVKNFTNILVQTDAVNGSFTAQTGDKSFVLTAALNNSDVSKSGKYDQTAHYGENAKLVKDSLGTLNYEYTLPSDFKVEDLENMRILAEASSVKMECGTDKNLSSFHSAYAQTTIGDELPSDMTVTVNGVEIDSVYLPDDPRDMRGTISLQDPYNGKTSAGDFGYLVNLKLTKAQLASIKQTLADSKKITVSYSVKDSAANKNGLRIYSAKAGRYAVSPTVLLNPEDNYVSAEAIRLNNNTTDMEQAGSNYSVEADVEGNATITPRFDGTKGYAVEVSSDKVTLKNAAKEIAGAKIGTANKHHVKVSLFDEHIRVYTDNNPDPVIDIYDNTIAAGSKVQFSSKGEAILSEIAITPETYDIGDVESNVEPTKELEETFDDGKVSNEVEKMPVTEAFAENADGKLHVDTTNGQKYIFKNSFIADGTVSADFTLTRGGNVGFIVRGSNYTNTTDGVDGYYVGVGEGFVQVGRMNQGWQELANQRDSRLSMNSTHKLTVTMLGKRMLVYIDNDVKPIVNLENDSYSAGGIAIRGYNASGTIDNIKVTNEPYYTDDFANVRGDWSLKNMKVSNGKLTASADNAIASVGCKTWTTGNVSATVRLSEGATAKVGTYAKKVGKKVSGRFVKLDEKANEISVVDVNEDTESVLAKSAFFLLADEDYKVTVVNDGTTTAIYVNDKKALSVKEELKSSSGVVILMSDKK
ncbi:MAG: hypothetical protein K6G65_02315, partial [Lachnospiraceae bacterium]|nr:hypothetical protein [Lachnospiraceae bacterium]